MDISRQDRVRMERAHVLAWPALRSVKVQGWLWRSSGGASQRANSTSTIDFVGNDIGIAVTEVEARYQGVGASARFHTFDDTSPPGLAEHLRDRGYRLAEPTVTMFKRLDRDRSERESLFQTRSGPGRPDHSQYDLGPGKAAATPTVDTRDHAWDLWRQVYLAEVTQDRRVVNTAILEQVPAPRAFFGGLQEGQVVSTALCVVGFGCAVIECVATRPDARRKGAARAVLTAVERWASQQQADIVGLQAAQGNKSARSLYRSLGFTDGAENSFWIAGGN